VQWLGLEVTADDIRQAVPNIDFAGRECGGMEMFAPDVGKVRQGHSPSACCRLHVAAPAPVSILSLLSPCARPAEGRACAPLLSASSTPDACPSASAVFLWCCAVGPRGEAAPRCVGCREGRPGPPCSQALTAWTASGSTPRPGM